MMHINKKTILLLAGVKKRIGAGLLALAIVVAILPVHADTPVTLRGQVVTRGLVVDENLRPILAEYGADGSFVQVLPPAIQNAAFADGVHNVKIMNGAAYRLVLNAFDLYRSQHQGDVARGATVMTAQEYADADHLGVVKVPQPNGMSESVPLPKPRSLRDGTKSVLVRSAEHLTSVAHLTDEEILLFEAPINLKAGIRDNGITDATTSVLLGPAGEVLHKTTNRISFRTAFYVPKDAPTEPEDGDSWVYDNDNKALGPIQYAMIDATFGRHIAISGEDGKFDVLTLVPPCMFLDSIPVTVAVPYKRFNPQSESGLGYRYVGKDMPLTCIPTPIFGPLGFGAFLAGYTDVAFSYGRVAVPVDLIGVTGLGQFVASTDKDPAVLPGGKNVEETEYDSTPVEHEYLPPAVDLDGNGHDDWVGAPQGTEGNAGHIYPEGHVRAGQVMVVPGGNPVCFEDSKPYLSCATDTSGNLTQSPMPHLYRNADPKPDLEHRGLLKQIGFEDLKDTTFYIYRAATGDLVAETHGVPDFRVYDNGKAQLGIDLSLPGPKGGNLGGAMFKGIEAYQEANGLTEAFTGKQNKDFLKPGDSVQVVAINRKTGYIGVKSAPISQDSQSTGTIGGVQNGLLTIDLGEFHLAPPNLKVEATRIREDDEQFQIGFEGAGLAQDTLIQITTEWLGPNNQPLPSNLPGYTGRLAKVVGDNKLASTEDSSAVAFFSIKPGRHQQVLKFKGDVLTTEHFYMHVNANPDDELADFSTSPDVSGILRYRPQYYVPFQVAIPDVPATREAQKNDNDAPGVYRWRYRPEMQFSVLDFEQLVLRQGEGEDLRDQDLLDEDMEVIDLVSGEAAQILYTILSGDYDPLPLIGPMRELLLGLGHGEYLLCLEGGQGGESGDCGQLDLTPEEIQAILDHSDGALALALYLSTDPANRLYEFEHFNLALGVDYNRDGKITYGKEDRTTADRPFVFWVNDDFDVVSEEGEANLEREECLPVEPDERQICEQEDMEGSGPEERNTNPTFAPSFANRYVESYRDLEDLFPVELRIPANMIQRIKDREYRAVLSVDSNVAINLFAGHWNTGRDHVQIRDVAQKQVVEPAWYNLHPGSDGFPEHREKTLEETDWTGDGRLILEEDGSIKLLVEAVIPTETVGALTLKILDKENKVISKDEIFFDFRPVEKLYEHWTVGRGHEPESPIADVATLTGESLNYTQRNGLELEGHEHEYILHVHGWRMQDFERRRFAETAMKRLYWEGYKGRFGMFSWPTGWFEKPPYWGAAKEAVAAARDPQNYDRSEAKARRSGLRLRDLLRYLRTVYSSLHVTAHSMGNVVVSEALRHEVFNGSAAPLVNSYVAMQSADVAQAYAPDAPEMNASIPGPIVTALAINNHVYLDGPDQPVNIAWPVLNMDCSTIGGELVCVGFEPFSIPPNQYQQLIVSPRSMAESTWVRGNSDGKPVTNYYYRIKEKAGRIVSFYNELDYALNGWEFNQMTKPDDGLSLALWPLDDPTWIHEYEDYQTEPERKVTDIYKVDPSGLTGDNATHEIPWAAGTEINGRGRPEILGHIIPARSHALGAEGRLCADDTSACDSSQIESVIRTNGNDTDFKYTSSAYDHSAQFLNSHIVRREFWETLLQRSGIISREQR